MAVHQTYLFSTDLGRDQRAQHHGVHVWPTESQDLSNGEHQEAQRQEDKSRR